ncbi:MAG: TSUP family transporter [Saprospiraceae bacterium]
MEILYISLLAFFISMLTFFSGFGLGTILTPVFMLFFPTALAVALTGVVHFFNNIFKLLITGRHIDRAVALRFGIPAVIFAFAGAWLLIVVAAWPPLFAYSLWGRSFTVYPAKFAIACLLIFFALVEIVPRFSGIAFGRDKLAIGGALSGFFGGLSGNQGALRSAFLIRAGLSKEAYIGTSVAISACVDFSRLGVYAGGFASQSLGDNLPLVASATLSAILGAFIGNRLLKKLTLRFVQLLVAAMLIIVSVALGAGWI